MMIRLVLGINRQRKTDINSPNQEQPGDEGGLRSCIIDYQSRIRKKCGSIKDNKIFNSTKKIYFRNQSLSRTERSKHLL